MAARASRVLLIVLLALAFAQAAPESLHAQNDDPGAWVASGGPVGYATHLVVDPLTPDVFLAFIAQSINRSPDGAQTTSGDARTVWAPYISTDGGDSWQPASNDLADVQPTALLVTRDAANSAYWLGTAGDGVWRSENNGRAWRPVSIPNLGNRRIVALTTDARRGLQLLALDNTRNPNAYLFSADSAGRNWRQTLTQPYTGEPGSLVTDLAADPFSVTRLYLVTSGGLRISDDSGENWRSATLPLPESIRQIGDLAFLVDPTQRGRLYLAAQGKNLQGQSQPLFFHSADSGETWQQVASVFDGDETQLQSLRPRKLRVDPSDRKRLLLATSNGIWLSRNSGETWAPDGVGLQGVALNDVVLSPNRRGRWYAAGVGGVWLTANAGSQWSTVTAGLPPSSRLRSIATLAGRPDTVLALFGGPAFTESDSNPVWRSEDGGITWASAMRGLESTPLEQLRAHPSQPNTVFGLSDRGLARSSNGGRTWQVIPLTFGPRYLAFGSEANQLFLAGLDGVWASTDGGQTWQASSLTEPVSGLTSGADGALFAATGNDTQRVLQRSDDGGANWEAIGTLPAGEITHFLAHPTDAARLILALRGGGLWASADGGRTWARSDSGIPVGTNWQSGAPSTPSGPTFTAVFIEPESPHDWWAARDGGGVHISQNNGASWNDVSTDLGDNLVLSFAPGADGVVAGTNALGLLRRVDTGHAQEPPTAVDARIEILWPHNNAEVTTAGQANLGLRLYASHSQESPTCVWAPNVEVWAARDAEPLRRLGLATQRTIEGNAFPFWDFNDADVTWANDPTHKLIFMARLAPGQGETNSSIWVHAADARTYLPTPPEPTGLTDAPPDEVDGVIRVVWPHNSAGDYVDPASADLVNISATLFARDTTLALASDHLPEAVWLVGALDNQVGRRLSVGTPVEKESNGIAYTSYEFNNIDVSQARDPAHHWSFWLDVPETNTASNVWVHGGDARTQAPELLEVIAGCEP